MRNPLRSYAFLHAGSAALLTIALSAGACGGSSDNPGSSGAGGASASCTELCDHVTTICGQTPPACVDACGQWTTAQRTCVGDASDCAGANACGSTMTTTTTAASGSTGSGGACVELQQTGCNVPTDCCPQPDIPSVSCSIPEGGGPGLCCVTSTECTSSTQCCPGQTCQAVPSSASLFCVGG